MEKIKSFIKSLNLRWSDLFMLLGFLPFTLFLIFGQLFMQYPNPNEVAFKLWAIILCFVISASSWGIYIYLERKNGNKPHNIVTWIFVILAIIGVIGIIIQPNLFQETIVVRFVNDINKEVYGDNIQIGDIVNAPLAPMNISTTHYVFFTMDILLILLFIYIGLFIFPKRFTNILFIKYFGYAVIILVAVMMFYSYIFEYYKFIPFIKALLGQGGNVYDYTLVSFIIHRNAYGMTALIGIVFCFINHTIERKWWYWLIAIFFFVNMIFSFCKTSILISALLIVVYAVYRLVFTYKEFPKRNRNILICGGCVAFLAILVVGISLVSEGKFLSPIYNLIKGDNGAGSLDNRTYIWDNCYQLLRENPIYYFFGRGFGLTNVMLLPMNTANGDKVFPTHSAFLNLLTEGGFFYLFAYLLFMGYSIYVIIKTYKKSPALTVAISLGVLAFTIYSIIETIHYLVYGFMFPVMILYHVSYLESQEVKQ